jgi:arginine decarboxylase
MRFQFPIIIIDEDFRSENASGLGIRVLAEAIEKEAMEVLGVTSYGDLTSFAQQQSRASAFILSVDDEELASEEEETIAELRAFVEEIRFKNAEIPIFLHGETRTSRHIPNDILRGIARLHPHVRGHTGVHRSPCGARGARLSGFPAPSILSRADPVRGGRLLFLALPGPLGRRGLPQIAGRSDVSPVLRREHAARRRL